MALVKNLALQRTGIGTLIVHNLHLVYLKKERKENNQTKKYITLNLYTTTQSLFQLYFFSLKKKSVLLSGPKCVSALQKKKKQKDANIAF